MAIINFLNSLNNLIIEAINFVQDILLYLADKQR